MSGLLLLAQVDKAPHLFSRMRTDTPTLMWVTALAIVLLALLALAWYLIHRLSLTLRRPTGDLGLFTELADAHKLSSAERKLLRRLARSERLDNPAKVFVERRHLEVYAKSHTNPAYRDMFQKLFGGEHSPS